MHAILASIASSCLVMQVLGDSHGGTAAGPADSQFKNQLDKCNGVRGGTNLPKVDDGVAPINEPCTVRDGRCSGGSTCCVTAGTCPEQPGRFGPHTSNRGYYEGGCTPLALNSSLPQYNPKCKQVGECHGAYLYASTGTLPVEGKMTKLPRATMDRLMYGSNWCSHTQKCQDEPCPKTESGVKDETMSQTEEPALQSKDGTVSNDDTLSTQTASKSQRACSLLLHLMLALAVVLVA